MRFITLFLVLLAFFSCHTGPKFVQTYNSALSIGDLMEVTVDTDALSYTYKITEGDFKSKNGGGTLKPLAGFNKNAYETSQGDIAIAIQNEVAIGAVDEDFFVGVPKQSTIVKIEEIAGLYNYVSYSPKGIDLHPNDKSSFGTLSIDKATWSLLREENLATSQKEPSFKGEIKDQGNGVIELWQGQEKIANFMPRKEADGSHFAVLDIIHKDIKGIGFATRALKVQEKDIATSFSVLLTEEMNEPVTGERSGTTLAVTEEGKTISYQLSFNAPWDGMIKGKTAVTYKGRDGLDKTGYYELFAILSKRSGAVYGMLHFIDANGDKNLYFPTEAFIGLKKE